MFLSFMILIFSAFSSWAEARVITFQDAVSLVSQNNPGLKAARENTQSSEELVGGSKSGFFPSLTGSVNATHDFPNTNVPYLDTQSGVAYSSSLTMSYNLFSGFKDVASVQQAKSQLAISRASLDSTKSSISNSLRQGFITLKYAQAKVKLTAAIVERRAQNERMIRAQYENGEENQGSYLLSQSTLEQSKFDNLQAIHQEVIAREAFAHVLGENDADITLSGDLPRHDPPGELNLNEIVKDTPTHRIQLGQIDNARANIKLTDSAYYPSLNLNGGVQNGDQILYTNSDQQWFVGLSLTIPLFSGLSTYYSAKSAHDLERASVDTSLASDFTTYEGLRSALYSFQEAVQLLRVSQLSLRALSVQEKIATKQYNNGIMTFENWDIIEDNLVTAEKTALSSDEGRDLSESSWRLAEGLGDLP